MKFLSLIVGFLFILMAALATPIAIGFGLYDWTALDMDFKFALWGAFKSWVFMIVIGLSFGLPLFSYGKDE